MGHDEIGTGSRIAERFVLGELIGRGGSARVYQAYDELLGREVAVKVFVEDTEHAANQVRSLTREMQTLAAVAHPGVVSVYDAGWTDGDAFIVMTLVRGGSLATWLAEHGPLPVDDTLRLGGQLCSALAHVHAHGVVHRDLKPGNVLLAEDGRPLLSDFGASADSDEQALTSGGDLIGTAGYLSPEQVRGEPVGPATDLYALGLLLLECLTARKEYPGPALQASVARLHRRPTIPPSVPAAVAPVLAALTADDPVDRPDAVEAGQALAATATGRGGPEPVTETALPETDSSEPVFAEPVFAEPVATTGPAARTGRHRPRTAQTTALAAASAVAAAGAVVVLTAFAAPSGPATPSSATAPATVPALAAPPSVASPVPPAGPAVPPPVAPQPVANTVDPAPWSPTFSNPDPSSRVRPAVPDDAPRSAGRGPATVVPPPVQLPPPPRVADPTTRPTTAPTTTTATPKSTTPTTPTSTTPATPRSTTTAAPTTPPSRTTPSMAPTSPSTSRPAVPTMPTGPAG